MMISFLDFYLTSYFKSLKLLIFEDKFKINYNMKIII